MLDDIPDDELRDWITEYVRLFNAHMQHINEKLDALGVKIDALEGVPGTLGTVEKAVSELTPLVQEAVEYLRKHPEIAGMSVRQAADETPYSKSTIGRAKKFIEENDKTPG